jgi:hypothetical protein
LAEPDSLLQILCNSCRVCCATPYVLEAINYAICPDCMLPER